jgi:hypothetical protein
MSNHRDEGVVVQTFARMFEDAYLQMSRKKSIPVVGHKTAQFYFYRIIDFMDSEKGGSTSTQAISKELILTLLQCSGRLYEREVHAKEATDLITCKEFQTILNIGIQGQPAQTAYEQCISNISDERLNLEDHVNTTFLSAQRENKMSQLDNKALMIQNIASLCHIQSDTLQNDCESARINEPFMFCNYLILVDALSLSEKSWLVTLLPHIFQWEQGICSDTKASYYKLIAQYGVQSPDSIVPHTLENADLTTYKDYIASNHTLVLPLCSSPNLNLGFLDQDSSTECFRLSSDLGNDAAIDKVVLSPPSDDTGIVTGTLQDHVVAPTTESIHAIFPLANSSNAAPVDKEAERLPATYYSTDAPVDRELWQLFDNMSLRVPNAHIIQKRMLQLLENPTPRQGWLKILQKSTIERHNLATVAVFILIIKTAIEASDSEGDQKQQMLPTILEESQEQIEPEGESKKAENEVNLAEVKRTDPGFLEKL